MNDTIWKYPLHIKPMQTIEMPIGSAALCVQMQHGAPCLWVEARAEAKKTPRTIYMSGTGGPRPIGVYLGTVQDGPLVWHFYDGDEDGEEA